MTGLLPDLRQVRAFVAVADEGSFTLAAKKLFLTQSAVSHSMKALEDSLGCQLLTRLGKKTVLTDEGEVFLRHSRKVLFELQKASRELDGLKRWGQSRIRIGAPHTLCQFMLPTVLREFRDCFPRCEPSIESGNTSELMERLKEHDLDVVLGLKVKEDPQFNSRVIFRDQMGFVVPPVHPWADAGKVTPSDFETMQFIIYAKATETHRLVEEYFDKHKVRPRTSLVLGDMEAIKEMSKIGMGVGIIAPWTAKREIEDGSLVLLPAGDAPIQREWAIFWNDDHSLSLIEETFDGIVGMVAETLAS